MKSSEYIEAIATIIGNYRRSELGREKSLDAAHVKRWVEQFEPAERDIVLRETFHVLERYYIKEERIHRFLEQVLVKILKKHTVEQIVFASVQKDGNSQERMYNYISTKGKFSFESERFSDVGKLYVYIDDGLYSGKRAWNDLCRLISLLPQGAHLDVYYMIAYSEGLDYWSNRIKKKAAEKQIEIDFFCGKRYENNKKETVNYEFLWPYREYCKDKEIVAFIKQLMETRKVDFLFCENMDIVPKLCSSKEAYGDLTTIFLKYGIKLYNQMKKHTFLPLGFGYAGTFGFGAFSANDWNIANNCPLVLWWGSIDESISGGWYPLLPRRNNKSLYQEICQWEKDFSVAANADILKTVYRLALEEERKNKDEKRDWIQFIESFDYDEWLNKRKQCDLLQYLKGLDMEIIKIIQTAMYIGRDYRNEKESINEYVNYGYEEYEEYEEYGYDAREERLNKRKEKKVEKVKNPDLLLRVWMEDLSWSQDWDKKEIEIDCIYSKKGCLANCLKRALAILGIS